MFAIDKRSGGCTTIKRAGDCGIRDLALKLDIVFLIMPVFGFKISSVPESCFDSAIIKDTYCKLKNKIVINNYSSATERGVLYFVLT